MTASTRLRAPFPYFGGKRTAAPHVWNALGDPAHYVEPFAGSLAVLLARPPFEGKRVETVNDANGWVANTWRAIRDDPHKVAHYAAGPVSEVDLHARAAWLNTHDGPDLIERLEGDPDWCDPRAAAYWVYVMCASITPNNRPGPWHVVDGRLKKLERGNTDAGRGIHRGLPHLGNGGRGIHRGLPHLGNGPGLAHEQAIAAWLTQLAERLQHARITCGDWARVTTPAILNAVTGGVGIFLDPPYTTSPDLYTHGTAQIADQVRAWCITAPATARIALAGYLDDHDELLDHGWQKITYNAGATGYNRDKTARQRERLWLSPACHPTDTPTLFPEK